MRHISKIEQFQRVPSGHLGTGAIMLWSIALLFLVCSCISRSLPVMIEEGIRAVDEPARCAADSDCKINSISFYCRRDVGSRQEGRLVFYSFIESKRDSKTAVASNVERLLKESDSFCEIIDDCDECMQCIQRIVFKSGFAQSYELPTGIKGMFPACHGGFCVTRSNNPQKNKRSNNAGHRQSSDQSERQFQLVAKMISKPDSAQNILDAIVTKTPDMVLRKVFWQGRIESKKKNYEQALHSYHRITAGKSFQPDPGLSGVELDPGSRRIASLSVYALYNSACVLALQSQSQGANRFLELTVQSIRNLVQDKRYVEIGLQLAKNFQIQIERDSDLAAIRDSAQFQATRAQLIGLSGTLD